MTPRALSLSLSLAVALPLATFAAGGPPPPSAIVAVQKADDFPDAAYALIKDYRVIWLGEVHGTQEAPELFVGVIKLLTRNDTLPIIAIEFSHRDQAAIDDFLRTGDTEILKTRTEFRGTNDGRTSEAMVKMLQSLRTLGVRNVLCIDPSPEAASPQARDDGMSANLINALKLEPNRKAVVLTGNFHSGVMRPPNDPNYRPAAYQVDQSNYRVISLLHLYQTGTTWFAGPDGYKLRPYGPDAPSSTPQGFYLSLGPDQHMGHFGTLFSNRVTGSPPAFR